MGPVGLVAAGCAAGAVLVMIAPLPARVRLARVFDRAGPPGQPPVAAEPARSPSRLEAFIGSRRGRAGAVGLAALAGFVLIGGGVGVLAGCAAGVAGWLGLGRLEPAARSRARDQAVAALPLVADLLAAALVAGCPPLLAAEVVGAAVGGPLGQQLVESAGGARLGVEPANAWSALAADPQLRPLARALSGAASRGASPVTMLERVALDGRNSARWAGEERARALGAKAAAPLGLCFLPAFVLLGIVPVVATTAFPLP
jgi:Flp pilus assembly protein TadB